MKALILKVNEAVKEKTVSVRLKMASELCTLYKLILDDGPGQVVNDTAALTTEQNSDDADPDGENEFILDEAAIHDDDASVELPRNGVHPRRRPGFEANSLIENWVAGSTFLIKTVFVHKAAAQAIQDKYFEGHSILFEAVEVALDETIKAMEDLSGIFDEYLVIKGKRRQSELNPGIREIREVPAPLGERLEPLAMDIQAIRARVRPYLVDPLVNEWVESANNQAVADLPNEPEEPGAEIWETPGRENQACEIPITVQGFRNTRTPQSFLEETYTAIVFSNGAVLRLLEVVTRGQIVIIQNMQLKQEAACRVVSYKPSMSVEGNAEVEFVQPAPDFWGITFAGENQSSRSDAAASTKHSPYASPGLPAEPTPVVPSTQVPRIEQRQTSEPLLREMKRIREQVEMLASPLTEVQPAMPEAIANTRQTRAISAPHIATSSMSPMMDPTPDDSLALYNAMAALYAVSTPAAAAAPAPPAPPVIAKVSVARNERPSIGEERNAGTLDGKRARSEVSKEKPSPETARRSEPSTIGLIEVSKEDLSKKARASRTDDTKPVSRGSLISKVRAFSRRKAMFITSGIAAVLILSGAGIYLRYLHSTATPSAEAAAIPQGISVAANSQSVLPTINGHQAPARQKQSLIAGSGNGKISRNKPGQDSTDAALRQPTTGTDSKTNTSISGPEISAEAAPHGGGGQNTLVSSNDSGNSVTAQPRTPGLAAHEQNYVGPRVLSTLLPFVYPKIAIQRGDEGDVMVAAKVNEAGRVIGTKVISGPPTLRQTAADWVSQWKFEPAKLNGKPTSASVTVKVVFRKP
jgi:TonB family protein